jgi:hypothetical protein
MSSLKKSSPSQKQSPAGAHPSKGAGKKHARELLDTGTDKRYVRRDENGRFRESDDVGRSLAQDARRRAKTAVKSGQGDRGDRHPSSASESTLRAWQKTYENRGK